MNKQAVKKWIRALRSRKYAQGTEYLNKDGKFCCLGVACHIFAKELGLKTKVDEDGNGKYISYNRVMDYMPPKLMKFLGLRTRDGEYINENGELLNLAEDNDNGASFEIIAQIIESNPEKLFVKKKLKCPLNQKT